MKSFSKHLPHYLALLGILFFGFLGFVLFSYDRGFQIAIAYASAASYVAWGIIHHWLHHDLYLAVVVEYLAIATLGLFIVLSLVLRA